MAWQGRERRGPRRTYLGAASGFETRQRVYATRDCLEIDEIEQYDVTRRRVFYDDVLLVTYHRFRGWVFLLLTGLAALAAAALSVEIARTEARAGLVLFALFGLPFLLAFVLRATLGVDAVTVYGRRSKARLHFPFRKGRAREVLMQICRSVRQAQQRLAARPAALRAGGGQEGKTQDLTP